VDDFSLLSLRADIDFTYDERGRMIATHEPLPAARTPAPRLLLARSSGRQIVRVGSTIADDLADRLTTLAGALPRDDAITGPFGGTDRLRDALALDDPITAEGGGPAYRFPERGAPRVPVVLLTAGNRDLARETYPWLFEELTDWWPCFAVVVDGAAVSVCFSARRGVAAAEAGLETHPDFRGRGYGAAVTAAWANAVSESGRVPIYSTSWENTASQGVARRLGLTMFGSDAWWL
jgi:hypothetical protein